jgi:hypothetical protein
LDILNVFIFRCTTKKQRLFFDKRKIFDFIVYYQFDDEANGADIFNFGLAVKPSKRLYV